MYEGVQINWQLNCLVWMIERVCMAAKMFVVD